MPSAALRPCLYPGCPELVSTGRCVKHTPVDHRDPDVSKLYNSQRWKQIRVRQLTAHPWCAECAGEGRYTPATDVDHITRHRGDPMRFYAGPFQSLCHACHSRKTLREVGMGAAVGRGA